MSNHLREKFTEQMNKWDKACKPTRLLFDANDKQQPPIPNDGPDIFKLVMEDISQRAKEGKVKYGVTLQPFNGRDALLDCYQEVLDLAQYLRQRIYEERGV